MLIKANSSILIVIDMQEKLVPAMQAPARTLKNTRLLMSTAGELDIPIMLTEQYPKGLGRTVAEIKSASAAAPTYEKLHFSCMEEKGTLPRHFEPTTDGRPSSPAWKHISV